MQPYFFPYIGYFQLIAASDIFVLHDDVQYIKGGWINRNRVLHRGRSHTITFPVQKSNYNLPINARNYVDDKQACKDIINIIKQAYAKAPFYRQVLPMIEELLAFEDRNVARFNEHLIRRIVDFIGIDCRIITSSAMDKNNSLTGEQRVLEMCNQLSASSYINPIGGTTLYHQESFKKNRIALHFLKTNDEPYEQGCNMWTPSLSIIDILMFNSTEEIRQLLTKYQLLAPSEIQIQN